MRRGRGAARGPGGSGAGRATACTEIYGGPDTLSISRARSTSELVDATFTRDNGCEIERFDRFAELLKALFPDYKPGGAQR